MPEPFGVRDNDAFAVKDAASGDMVLGSVGAGKTCGTGKRLARAYGYHFGDERQEFVTKTESAWYGFARSEACDRDEQEGAPNA